jgi:ATP-binding protein involved in chromosome partitioning
MTDDLPNGSEPPETPEGNANGGAGCGTGGGPPSGNYRPIDDPTFSSTPIDAGHAPAGNGGPGDDSTAADLPDEDRIRAALVPEVQRIETPHGDLVSAEVLTDVEVEDGVVTATVDASGLDAGTADRVTDQLLGAALAIEGVDHCRIESARRERAEGGLAPNGAEAIVAIAGAKGGVGKSTLTVALARQLRDAGLDVGIFDADFEAPAVSELLGVEGPVTTTATGNAAPAYTDGLQVVSLDLVAGDRPVAWRGAMAHDVLADLLGDAAWNDRDVLLVDLPPGVGEVAESVFSRVPVDGTVLVTTPADVSLRSVERTAGLADAFEVPVAAVVENMAGEAGIHAGERAVEDLLDTAPGEPSRVRIPFDPALQRPAAVERSDLAPETAAGLDDLAGAVRAHLARITEDVPDDAVDLSGLPERARERQAVLEFGAAPDGPRPLVVGDDDLLALLEREFDAELSVTDLESGRRLLRSGGESA